MKWRAKEPTIPEIKGQLLELMPLPMGRQEFEEWSDRIISGALVKADKESLQFALASMILHDLAPTDSHKEDAYFIHKLRKAASNQVAHDVLMELRDAAKAKLGEQKDAPVKLLTDETKVLADGGVQKPPADVGSKAP